MRAKDLAANQPSNRTAHNNIRGKMLFSEDARCAHGRGQAIDRKLCKRTGIFVGDDAGDGPGYRRVVRWKRDAMLKKIAEPLALVGALSSKRVFECRIDGKTVDRGFS